MTCEPKHLTESARCPQCQKKLKSVGRITVESLIVEDEKKQLRAEAYAFCPNPDCDVVYVSALGDHQIPKEKLTVRVGIKEREEPIPLCYCFGFSRADIFQEVEERGETSIPERIRARVKGGECFCERSNPRGACCLGDIAKAVKDAQQKMKKEAIEQRKHPI